MKSFVLSSLVLNLISIFSVSLFGFGATGAARASTLPTQTDTQTSESKKKTQPHTAKTRKKNIKKESTGQDMSGMKMGKEKPAAQPSEPTMPGMETQKSAVQPSQPAMQGMEMSNQRPALKPMGTGGGSMPEIGMNPYFTALNFPLPKDMMMIMVLPDFQAARSTRNFLTEMTMVEYGITPRWTVAFMAEGQKIPGMPVTFGGLRIGTYFHILPHDHLLNFTLYGEYEDLNEAALYKMEVAGFGGEDLSAPLAEARRTPVRTFEQRAIMYHDWGRVNLTFNFISETGIDSHENDFGYTWGVFRKAPWTGMVMDKGSQGMNMDKGAAEINGTKASPPPAFSMRRLGYGLEMMGALGNQHQFGFVWPSEQQYVGPVFNYALSQHWSVAVEPTFGLSRVSDQFVLRMGLKYSIDRFAHRLARAF